MTAASGELKRRNQMTFAEPSVRIHTVIEKKSNRPHIAPLGSTAESGVEHGLRVETKNDDEYQNADEPREQESLPALC